MLEVVVICKLHLIKPLQKKKETVLRRQGSLGGCCLSSQSLPLMQLDLETRKPPAEAEALPSSIHKFLRYNEAHPKLCLGADFIHHY